jgi:hypothetical protein
MKSRWFRGEDLDRSGKRSHDFDPVAEGSRYGLAPAVSLEIWARVCAEAADSDGLRDEDRARQRFHEIASRVAAKNGLLHPDPGRTTRVEMAAPDADRERDVFAPLAPGRITLQEVEARRWDRRLGDVEPTTVAAKAGLPHKGEVAALLARLSSDASALAGRSPPAQALGRHDAANAVTAIGTSPVDTARDRAKLESGRPLCARERCLFRHALIRDAAYEMLTSTGRRRVHKQIAGALEQHFPDAIRADPGVLAGHLFEAGSHHSATDYGIRATMIALQQSAFDEAISRSHTLLGWIKELPEADRASAELQVNSILTPSLMNKYGWAAKELGDTASRSLELLPTAGDSPHRVPTLWWIVMNRLVAGNRGTLADLTRQLRTMANQTNDPGAIAAADELRGFLRGRDLVRLIAAPVARANHRTRSTLRADVVPQGGDR